jgi:hypothetical protein
MRGMVVKKAMSIKRKTLCQQTLASASKGVELKVVLENI